MTPYVAALTALEREQRRDLAFAAIVAQRRYRQADIHRVYTIRAALDAGMSCRVLGRMLNISATTVSRLSRLEIS